MVIHHNDEIWFEITATAAHSEYLLLLFNQETEIRNKPVGERFNWSALAI